MALSQADFYAYSRATGAPVPEDPQERAQMAPEVAEFRRNQLKAPEQGQQQGQNALASLAGIGALALAGVGAYRLAKGRLPKGSPASATAPVQTIDIARAADRSGAVRRAAEEMPQPSTPPKTQTQQIDETLTEMREEPVPQFSPRQYLEATGAVEQMSPVTSRSLMPTEEEAMQQYSRQLAQEFPEPTQSEMQALEAPSRYSKILSRLGTVPAYRPDPKDINYARFGPVAPEVAIARREQATQDLLQFARQRQEDAALVANQTMGALESGEDQITGRVKNQLQRNEDLDLTQVEALENTQGDIRVAASQLPDGVPKDQIADPSEVQRELDLAKIAEYQVSRQAQLQKSFERGLGPARAGRNVQMTESQRAAFERLAAPSQEDALTYQRAEPSVARLGSYVQPASKTALRGTSGRPELGIYGIEAGTTPGREVWGAGSVITGKEVLTTGENPITRPQAYRPNLDFPEEQTPEGYVYTQAAMERPTRVRYSKQPLVQEATPERLESVNLSEEVRRLQRTGGDVQSFLTSYKQNRGLI